MLLNHKIISNRCEFKDIKEEWNKLLALSSSDTIFMTWEWQFSWWESFGGELFIITIYEKRNLLAVLPFIISRKLNIHILKFIGAPDSDYLDIIVKKGIERDILEYFFNRVLNENRKIGIVKLHSINETSPTYSLINKINNNFNVAYSEKICPYIPLPERWDDYWKSLSSKKRYNISSREKKLLRDFKVETRTIENSNELEKKMNDFIRLHQQRWTSINRPGAFASKSFRNFHMKIAHILLNKGLLKFYFLELNKRPVASRYMFCYNNKFLDYLGGFDPAYYKYGIGVFLLKKVIQDAIETGMEEFDFMRGTGAYKFIWTSKKRVNRSFVLTRRKFTVHLYCTVDSLINIFAALIKKKVSNTAKEKIRKYFPTKVVERFDHYFNPYS